MIDLNIFYKFKEDMSFVVKTKVLILNVFIGFFYLLIILSNKILGHRGGASVAAAIAESIVPVVKTQSKFGLINFYCPGKWPILRSDMTKEPNTYEWIDGFDKGDVFYDIGANVGVYSLYAALKGHLVVAFEPSIMNYFVLAQNVMLNHFDERIMAFNVALNDVSGLNYLYIKNNVIGSAQHTFGYQEKSDINIDKYEKYNKYKQLIIGYSLDDIKSNLNAPFPNHIKIDTDGNELRIIKGAKKILRDERVKSMSIELGFRQREIRASVISELQDAGLRLIDNSKGNTIFSRT